MRKTLFQRVLPAALYTLLLAGLIASLFDYYFDLNDDVLIKDILAGVQTGAPSAYCIQMLYPVSLLIAGCYRLFGKADWFGLFLCACQYLCVFLLAERSLFLYDRHFAAERHARGAAKGTVGSTVFGRMILEKMGILVIQGVFFGGFFLRQLVYVQYTVVCGVMTATAVFLLYTTPEETTAKQFLQSNIGSMLLLVTAFCVRTEMFLLLTPLIGAAGLCRWLKEGFVRQWRKYAGVIACVAAGLGAVYLLHMAAYSGPEWREFQRIFDARTQIYDFYGLPEYEEHQAFYESIGMSPEEYALLDNYNYGVDEALDAARLERIEAYAGETYRKEHRPAELFKTAVWEYKQRILGKTDMPYSGAVLIGYLCVAAAMLLDRRLLRRRPLLLWQPVLLFAAGSVSWFYILYRQRVVERITVPLYLTELLLLAAMLLQLAADRQARGEAPEQPQQTPARQAVQSKPAVSPASYVYRISLTVLALWSAFLLPRSVRRAAEEQQRRGQVNEAYEALRSYCAANRENYYYVDVYSTVKFSEKMFEKVDNSGRNYDIIGGWACKSPVGGQEELRYLITDSSRNAAWLEAYYERTGVDRTVSKADEFSGGGDCMWEVYEVNVKGKSQAAEGEERHEYFGAGQD